MAIRLFQSNTSMFCEKVRVVLAMKKVPYEIVDVKKDERKSLIEYSGQTKVPVMDHNGQCILDSTFISAFLEEKYPEPTIYPGQASDKGLCLMLEDWSDEVLNRVVLLVRRAETPEARSPAEKELAVHLRSLDLLFEKKKFIFDRMNLADISIFGQIHYLYTVAKYEVPKEYENLHGWMDLMRQALKLPSLYDVAA
jgi:glutathione S-transferase